MGAYSDENPLRTQRIAEETPGENPLVERASGAFTLAKGKVAPVEHHAGLSYRDVAARALGGDPEPAPERFRVPRR